MLHLTSAALLSHLAASFQQLVKDRMLLSAEVMREYDKRFVYKKVFATRVDRQVQTEEGESNPLKAWADPQPRACGRAKSHDQYMH